MHLSLWLGLLDMAYAARMNRPPRASGALAQHVLEAMVNILSSAEQGGAMIPLSTTCERPAPLPRNFSQRLKP